jgi:tRNA (cmo5U34)-methyltransferase
MMKENKISAVPPREATVDRIFADDRKPSDFTFSAETAKVFDDMVSRSVPFYDELQRMTTEMARDFAQPGTALYDLGCATGTTFALLDPVLDPSIAFVGVDNAAEMLAKAKEKLAAVAKRRMLELECADLNGMRPPRNASFVVMILTLQFVRPLHRERVAKKIYDGMNKRGAFILIEKLTAQDSGTNRLFIDYYHQLKRRRGYSDMEIAQKREALENVLIPYRIEENIDLLRNAGFRSVESFFRWYNFCGILATK